MAPASRPSGRRAAAAFALAAVGGVSAIDNGLGLTPPRGWRSWNAFNCLEDKTIITQAHMVDQMKAAVDKSRTVDGKPTSLAELGFNWISMDDGWQQCNCSTRQDVDPSLPQCPNLCFGGFCTWHDEAGVPRIRKDRFQDMAELVRYGHSLGLKVGTYLNNCICMEAGGSATHYEEDVRWMAGLGFDGVKVDSCGSSKNVSHWAELFNATGKPIRIENCHNGWPDFKTGSCPMNFFRTGGDISPDIGDILGQAYGTVDASDLPEPRSRPGCWGYPDMSEIGNFAEGPYQLDQERTHWGLWCIVSSPLILGFDMKDQAKMDRVWPIITNRDALSVSEAWVGHPGTLIKVYPSAGRHSFQAVQAPCDGSPRTLGWRFDGGNLTAPKTDAMAQPQCLHSPAAAACPPPTTRSREVQCGLLLSNCSAAWRGSWRYEAEQVQWSDGNPADKPQCLGAFPINFDVTAGYFIRQAATLRMNGCQALAQMPRNSSCAAPRRGVDVSSPQVITPKDPSKVCNVDLETCCAACDGDVDCKAYVWKEKESHGIGCPGSGSYCWLLSGYQGTHAASGTFGAKGAAPPSPPPPAPPSPPAPSPPSPPPSPGSFRLTDKGELQTAHGTCLAAAPVSGVELWAKPVSKTRIAVLLVNPTDQVQPLRFPWADVPDFEGVSLGCGARPCDVRDVWQGEDVPGMNDPIEMELRPFASRFYLFSMRTADTVLLSV